MIFPAQNIRIVVSAKPIDFRRGHDGLVALVQAELGLDPHSGVVVVFRSRRSDRMKVLLWDGTGLVLVYKRLEQGGFAWPPIREGIMKLSVAQFEALFAGLDWRRVHTPKIRPPTAAE
jgi:transposase